MQRRWKGKNTRAPRGLTREQAAIWTVVFDAYGASWLALDLVNRLLEQERPFDRILRKLANRERSRGHRSLPAEQQAVGELMCAAVGEHSESVYAASWLSGIEHLLWDEVCLRKEDAYERACSRLCKLAGTARWRRPRKRSLFAEGFKLLSERFGVWIRYESGKGERVVSLKEWARIHEEWIRDQMRRRQPYEKVWEQAHFEFGRKRQRPVPPMPKIPLPPFKPRHES